MSYTMTWEQPNGMYFKFFGTLSISDVYGALIKSAMDPNFANLRYRIFDYVGVTELIICPNEMTLIKALLDVQDFGISQRVNASIAPTDSEIHEYWQYWACINVDVADQSELFTCEIDARTWIATHPLLDRSV
jgi:hypothetical protein